MPILADVLGSGLFSLPDADLNIVDGILGIFIVHKFHEDIIAQEYNIYNIYNNNLYNLTDIDIKKALIYKDKFKYHLLCRVMKVSKTRILSLECMNVLRISKKGSESKESRR